jgi:hypothetical protein
MIKMNVLEKIADTALAEDYSTNIIPPEIRAKLSVSGSNIMSRLDLNGRVLSGLKLAALVAAVAASCFAAEQFPAPKEWKPEVLKKPSKSLPPSKPTSKRAKTLYDLIGFTEYDIGRTRKRGTQTIMRLKDTNEVNDINRTCHKIPFLATIADATLDHKKALHYVLKGDNKSWLEISYDPDTNSLKIIEYAVKEGMVKTPLPGGYRPYTRSKKLNQGQVSILHNFLKQYFEDSIFNEQDVFVDQYLEDADTALRAFKGHVGKINATKTVEGKEDKVYEKYLIERAELLEDAAQSYKRISEVAPGEEWEKRADVKVSLMELYKQLMDEHTGGAWNEDPTKKLNRIEQSTQIIRSLQSAGEYLGIK